MDHLCPCCGHVVDCPKLRWLPFVGLLYNGKQRRKSRRNSVSSVGFVIGTDDTVVYLRSVVSILFDVLWKRFLANEPPIANKKLIEVLYADDPHGGPDNAKMNVSVYLCHLRASILPVGLDVLVYRSHCALVPIGDESHRKKRAGAVEKYRELTSKWREANYVGDNVS